MPRLYDRAALECAAVMSAGQRRIVELQLYSERPLDEILIETEEVLKKVGAQLSRVKCYENSPFQQKVVETIADDLKYIEEHAAKLDSRREQLAMDRTAQ